MGVNSLMGLSRLIYASMAVFAGTMWTAQRAAPQPVSADAALAAARDQFSKAGYDEAAKLLTDFIAAAAAGRARGEAKELLGDCYIAKQQWDRAIAPLAEAADENPPQAAKILPKLTQCEEALPVGMARLDALQKRAALEARVLGPDAARATYLRILADQDAALKALRDAPDVHFYLKSRGEVDRPAARAAVHRQIARLLMQQGDKAGAVAAWQAALLACPTDGAAGEARLELGGLVAETRPAEALAYLVEAVDFLGDRDQPTATAKLPENAAFLKAVSTPHSPEFLKLLFSRLGEVAKRLPGLRAPGESGVDDVVGAWQAGEKACYEGRIGDGTDQWRAIAGKWPGTVVANMAHVAAAQWAYDAGRYGVAQDELASAAVPSGSPGAASLDSLVLFHKGHLALAEGDLAAARERFEGARQASDVGLSALARLRLAETCEALGDVTEATLGFQALSRDFGGEYFGQMAAMGLRRLEEHDLRELRKAPAERAAIYLGEDRQTGGEWRVYGRDAFILCAGNGLDDLCGAKRWAFTYRAYLGSGEKVWFWTALEDPHRSMLYNPVRNVAGPFNWDDGGEKAAMGTGPDLFLDLEVPPGRFRLSLYFVNDHNYYEPSREYTLYLTDTADPKRVLAACPVRNSLQGVYEHFAVAGPRKMTVRVFRNLAMNTLMTGVFLDEVAGLPEWSDVSASLAEGARTATGPIATVPTVAWRSSLRSGNSLDAGLSVGAAERRADETERRFKGLKPWDAAAVAWSAFLNAAESGCGRPECEAWLGASFAAVQTAAGDKAAREWLASVSERLLEAGYTGYAEMADAIRYPIGDPAATGQSVTVPLALADRYATVVPYWNVPNRGMPPTVRPTQGPLDRRLATTYMNEVARRLWAEQPDRAKKLSLMLADQYLKKQWLFMARVCYESAMGPAHELEELTPAEHWAYARTIREEEERLPVVDALVGRATDPRKETVYRGDLLWCELQTGKVEEAEAEARRILELDVAPGYKCFHIFNVAVYCYSHKDAAKAAEWCRVILDELPGTPVVEQAQRMLQDIAAQPAPKQGGA